ncbi:MAG: VOC family protein [Bryobacterales bacterium]|nr:VOC family protein [Bryobacterales bacterium]MBV9400061.1 VOC family protein [Bryobacterales bacterium]
MTAATETTGVRKGFTTVTPYLTVADPERLVQFVKDAFGAVETGRSIGGSGHLHCEVQIGDSMLMCGGGARGRETPLALHLYVPDVDAVYDRAIAAGGESLRVPEDRPYGERQGGVKDPTGNLWYIATRFPGVAAWEGMRTVTPYLHHTDVLGLIDFLKRAFNAEELGVFKSPEGRVMHAALRIGTAILEMGETTPMPASLYLYVPDADSLYGQALAAGAKSLLSPANQPYGDRLGVVEDNWGNSWCIATHLGQQTQ